MQIAVLVKQVPAVDTVKIDETTGTRPSSIRSTCTRSRRRSGSKNPGREVR